MALGRTDGLLYDVGEGYSALDAAAARNRLDGFAVVSGLGVSVSTGLTLSVASGTATVGQSSGSVDTVSLGSSTTITLDAADSTNPRKDTIYIDTAGTVQKETGTAEAADPSGNTRFNTFQPEPPEPSTDGVILAEVWVGAGVSSLTSADIRDRRQPAQSIFDRLYVRDVGTDLLPDADGSRDLGSSSLAWQNAFINSVTTDRVDIGSERFVDAGDQFGVLTIGGVQETGSFGGSSYSTVVLQSRFRWDRVFPANATIRVTLGGSFDNGGDQIDARVQNFGDSETIIEGTDLGSDGGSEDEVTGTYTPPTTDSVIPISLQIKNNDDNTSVSVSDPTITFSIDT